MGSGIELSILLDGEKERPRYVSPRLVVHELLPTYMPNTYPLYNDGESVSGTVKNGKCHINFCFILRL